MRGPMYLREIFLQNTGPILECMSPGFDDAGNPLPIIVQRIRQKLGYLLMPLSKFQEGSNQLVLALC